MAQGQERIERTQDSLRGAEAVQPVTRNVPGISAPATPSLPVDSFGSRMTAKLGAFISGELQQVQQRRQEASMRDGQIAAMQGKAFEEVEMEGDKWALEGYRVVTATTMASGLLNAQQSEIQSGAYEEDPDAYRARLMQRMETMTGDIQDPRTRQLAQEQMLSQIPTLVDQHMKSNLAFKEQQNFDAIVGGMDTLSKDPNATEALIGFAQGTNGATAGLSQARRNEAVVQGLINSFTNGNPSAYAKLEAAGYFNTANLPAAQIQQIEAAKAQFHQKMEGQYNEEWTVEDRRIQDLAKDPDGPGEIKIAEMVAANNAKHWRRSSQAELGQVYDLARENREWNEGTRGMLIQTAKVKKDFPKQASLMMDALVHQESRGNGSAVSPKGARGLTQIMPGTAMSPGFGLPNVFEVADSMGIAYEGRTQAEAERLLHNDSLNYRYGERYLATMLKRYDGNETAALAAYNMGPGNVDSWLAKGGNVDDLNAETKDYVKKIQSSWRDDIPDPRGTRVLAEAGLKAAQEGAAMHAYEQALPGLNQLDEDYRRGRLTREDWMKGRREEMSGWGMAVDMNTLNHEAQINRSVIAATETKVAKAEATQNEIAFADDLAVANREFQGLVDRAKAGDPTAIQQVPVVAGALADYRASLYQKHSITPEASTEIAYRDGVDKSMFDAINEGQKNRVAWNDRQRAVNGGFLNALPVDQQKQALAEFDKGLQKKYTDLAASQRLQGADSSNYLSDANIGAAMAQERNNWLAKSGMIDETTKRIINSGMNQPPMIDGEINPAYRDAIQTWQQMSRVSPHVADQYIDEHNKGPLYAITGRLGTAGNVDAAIQTFALAADARTSAPFKSPEEMLADPNVQKRINSAAKGWANANAVSTWRAAFGRASEFGQQYDRRGLDYGMVKEQMTDALTQEVASIQQYHPNLSPEDVIQKAGEQVQRRYALVGNDLIDFGRGNDAYHQFFGERAEEMRGKDDAVNSAIVNYLRSDEFVSQHPEIAESSWGEWTGLALAGRGLRRVGSTVAPWWVDPVVGEAPAGPLGALYNEVSGFRPYSVYHMPDGMGGTTMMLTFEDGMGGYSQPIELDPARIGAMEIERIRNRQ